MECSNNSNKHKKKHGGNKVKNTTIESSYQTYLYAHINSGKIARSFINTKSCRCIYVQYIWLTNDTKPERGMEYILAAYTRGQRARAHHLHKFLPECIYSLLLGLTWECRVS